MNQLGEKIKALREERGLTQGDLAALIGVTQGRISHCESGKRPVSLKMAVKITCALDLDKDELVPSVVQAVLEREVA
jgi:transcriptional regulator with XRE-family HTH domain